MAAVVGDDGNSPAQPNVCNTRHTRARPAVRQQSWTVVVKDEDLVRG